MTGCGPVTAKAQRKMDTLKVLMLAATGPGGGIKISGPDGAEIDRGPSRA